MFSLDDSWARLAHGFPHRCYKHQPPHCLMVKMMKLKFFHSPRVRKLCSLSGIMGRETEWSQFGVRFFFDLSTNYILCKNTLICKNVFHKYSGLHIRANCYLELPGSLHCGCCSVFSIKLTSSWVESKRAVSLMTPLERNGTWLLYNDGNRHLAWIHSVQWSLKVLLFRIR